MPRAFKITNEEVLDTVRQMLAAADLRTFSIDTVSQRIGMSEQAIHRRLVKVDTTFRAEKRREQEHRLRDALEDSPTCTTEFLTELCGFNAKASFSNFFIASMGKSLTEWRREAGVLNHSSTDDTEEAECS